MNKKELRKNIKQQFTEKLANESESLYNENSSIEKLIINSELFIQSDVILSYFALPDEVNLFTVNKTGLFKNKLVALPRIAKNGKKMDFYFSKNQSQKVQRGYCGIFEPDWHWKKLTKRQLKNKNVLVLVPGRAFTKDGYRLGRGKGFYDKYLAQLKKASCKSLVLCGVAFNFQIVNEVPADEHDIKLDSVYFLPSFE